jgi:hypothetical protein
MVSSPTPERIRLTISVTPEVHEIFTRMAEAAGMSLGRCMGEWLADTADGAQFVAQKMGEARKAPKTVMREMRSMALGVVDAVDSASAGLRSASPPSSNTGGKVPQVNPKRPRK